LGGFRTLNGFEGGGIELKNSTVLRNTGQANSPTDENVKYPDAAADGFFKQLWTFDGQQTLTSKLTQGYRFSEVNDFGVVLA
jgi:hypothetical protein